MLGESNCTNLWANLVQFTMNCSDKTERNLRLAMVNLSLCKFNTNKTDNNLMVFLEGMSWVCFTLWLCVFVWICVCVCFSFILFVKFCIFFQISRCIKGYIRGFTKSCQVESSNRKYHVFFMFQLSTSIFSTVNYQLHNYQLLNFNNKLKTLISSCYVGSNKRENYTLIVKIAI